VAKIRQKQEDNKSSLVGGRWKIVTYASKRKARSPFLADEKADSGLLKMRKRDTPGTDCLFSTVFLVKGADYGKSIHIQ